MYLNTMYKAFVAKAAASLYAEMVGKVMNKETLEQSFDDNKHIYEHLAIQATGAAEVLAQQLDDNWHAVGDQSTVFFDPQDTPMSGIEEELSNINKELTDLNDTMCHGEDSVMGSLQRIADSIPDTPDIEEIRTGLLDISESIDHLKE